MVKFLTGQENEKIKIFNRFIDCYMVGAAIGIAHDLMVETIPPATDDKAKVFEGQLLGESDTLEYLYVMAMLNYKGTGFTEGERIDRAFKYPNQDLGNGGPKGTEFLEKMNNESMKIFNRYALGGLEYIYDYFKPLKNISNLKNDDVDNRIMNFVMDNLDLSEQDLYKLNQL